MTLSSPPVGVARGIASEPAYRRTDEGVSSQLPAWPVWALFALYPLWWVTGLADVIVIPLAVLMTLYLGARGRTAVPPLFLVWLLFVVMMLGSSIGLHGGNQVLTFSYRAAIYLSATVFFVYVYNARQTLRDEIVAKVSVAFWLITVVGGALGVLFPAVVVKTPLFYVLSSRAPGLVGNEVVNHWVIRRFAQYSVTSWLGVAPRPSAPFLYTNNWGNAYSILLPVVVAFLLTRARARTLSWWLLVALVPLSAVPAFLTLNRGMFIGLGIVGGVVALRMVMSRNLSGLVVMFALTALGGAIFALLPVHERLQTRLQGDSTSTRASLYAQALRSLPASPIFGYGVPLPSDDPAAPPVGTQGQIWMVLVSHGIVAAVCFVGFFLLVVAVSFRKRDPFSIASNAVLLAVVIESTFYGLLHTLPLLMVLSAALLRTRAARPKRLQTPRGHTSTGLMRGRPGAR